jgi:hypothetical protein
VYRCFIAILSLQFLSSCFVHITGNHEYYTGDVDAWMEELELLGVRVLHNSHVIIQHPKNPTAMLSIAGVDDAEGGIFR